MTTIRYKPFIMTQDFKNCKHFCPALEETGKTFRKDCTRADFLRAGEQMKDSRPVLRFSENEHLRRRPVLPGMSVLFEGSFFELKVSESTPC